MKCVWMILALVNSNNRGSGSDLAAAADERLITGFILCRCVWLSFIFCLYCTVFLYCVLKRCKPQGFSHAGVALRPPVMKDLSLLYRGITGSYCGTRQTRFRCLLWSWVSVQEVCRRERIPRTWCHREQWRHVWTEDEHTHQSDTSNNN